MPQPLLDAIRRYAEVHADPLGIARVPISGMNLVRTTSIGELQYGIQRPLICLVVQGTKEVTMGSRTLAFSGGDSMLITADVPTVSQISRASRIVPYLSFALYLDPALIAELSTEMKAVSVDDGAPLTLQPTDGEVADTALRMVRLLDRPASIPMLQAALVREMHYWLLAGRHGPAIRHLGFPDSHARRIGRAVDAIRADYAVAQPVENLARIAGMSVSTFHHHFRAVTSLSPLQFQKQLRLIEARRMMLAESAHASNAAYAVGYESVPQFTREYRRLFGQPPVRDVEAARQRVTAA
ncbi:AraC family transcriptional regulator [Sphingomonas sp. AP4-R1]|uniref:AraC family transcriptional regulator n=1 Tax=Sphingomonas sp. AP4-R1 TaxID=2735134 RepID=UPI001493A1A0|nr:AraC family transcriptional regulator [Sphingomonas sp. AP4-R1]QJU60044.1 AraC family transcriptional regulator [Sphingomonas sp. AP4-R1]